LFALTTLYAQEYEVTGTVTDSANTLLMNDEGYRKEFYLLSGSFLETQIISNEK
jgi:hypothetical protein